MIRIKVGSRTSAIKKAFVHGTRAVRSPPHRQGSTAFMIPARALHEGRTVLDVGLGPRDHVIQVDDHYIQGSFIVRHQNRRQEKGSMLRGIFHTSVDFYSCSNCSVGLVGGI